MMIPAPVPGGVPCSDTCGHIDCGSARAAAHTPCVRCHQPIGYTRRFRRLSGRFDGLVEHHHCPTGQPT